MEQAIDNITIVQPATKIVLRRVIIELGAEPNPYAILDVDYVVDDGKVINRAQVGLTAEELEEWGSDDSVLLPIAVGKLGVTAI